MQGLKPRHVWQPNSWVMNNSLYPFRLNDAAHEFASLQCFPGLRRIVSKFSSLQWYTSGEQMWIASEGWRGFMPSYCWDPELVVSCPLHAVAHRGYSWQSMGEWTNCLPCQCHQPHQRHRGLFGNGEGSEGWTNVNYGPFTVPISTNWACYTYTTIIWWNKVGIEPGRLDSYIRNRQSCHEHRHSALAAGRKY